MSKSLEIKTVIFDKNINRIIKSEPVFEALFENIYTLTALNSFLAQKMFLDENFIKKLNFNGIRHQFCYKIVDKTQTLEFNFFLLSESWSIVNINHSEDADDGLTKLLSEKHTLSMLRYEITRSTRDKEHATTIIMDIRHLKNINEMYGYLVGDYVLKTVAHILQTNTRSSDAIGRYRGGKFIIALHKTDAYGTMQYLKKIEKELTNRVFKMNDFTIEVTVAFGITMCKENDTTDSLLDRANKALVKAKKSHASHIEYLL